MMERRAKYGPAAIQTAGIVFASTGGLLSAVMIFLLFLVEKPEAFAVFAILGPGFLALGIGFLIVDGNKRRIARELMESGHHVWGSIIALQHNTWLRVNGRYPWSALVRYVDGAGEVHLFKSRGYTTRSEPDLVGRLVKVYVGSAYKRSHVDLESME